MAKNALNHPLTPHLIQFFDTDGSGFIDASELVKVILCALTLQKKQCAPFGNDGLGGWQAFAKLGRKLDDNDIQDYLHGESFDQCWPQG